MNETTVAEPLDVAEDVERIDDVEEPVAEPLIEEISIDGMCGVY